MKAHRWLIGAGLVLAAGPALTSTSTCGLPKIAGARELHQFLSLRAVELVRRAERRKDVQALVASSASFSLGAGDVGRPLGSGVAGARQLARTMAADTFRFLGWDYMDEPADACSRHEVEVEFIDSRGRLVSQVKFTFEAGRVVSAAGWQRSYESGPIGDASSR